MPIPVLELEDSLIDSEIEDTEADDSENEHPVKATVATAMHMTENNRELDMLKYLPFWRDPVVLMGWSALFSGLAADKGALPYQRRPDNLR